MAIYKLFDINTSVTVKPWGAREEQAWKDIIDTLVVDTIDATKNVGGHLHGKVYASDSVAAIDAQTSTTLTLNLRDDIASGLLIKNRNNDSFITIDSSTSTPKVTFNCGVNFLGLVDIDNHIALSSYKMSYDGSTTDGITFDSNNIAYIYNTVSTIGDNRYSLSIEDYTSLAEGVGPGIRFDGVYTAGGSRTALAGICAYKTNATDNDASGQLHFQTRKQGSLPATQLIIDEDGDVSIGSGTPAANKLAINESDSTTYSLPTNPYRMASLYNGDGSVDTMALLGYGIETATGTGVWFIGGINVGNTFSTTEFVIGARTAVSTYTERFRIDKDGNVGIGSATPAANLHVESTSPVIRLEDSDAASAIEGTARIDFIQGLGPATLGYVGFASSSNYDLYLRNRQAGGILFYGNDTVRMTLDQDGGLYMAGASGSSQGAGTINATAVYDDGVILTDYVFEKHYDKDYIFSEDNEPAETFETRYEICKDIDTFLSFIKDKKCLPAFDYDTNEKVSISDRFQKLLESVETMVYYFDNINTRLKTLEAV